MIVLTVQSYNGTPSEPLSASFDELGGTIGRADTNQLVLPDPERSISRIHAQVVFRNGSYAIADRGSNPISVNGQPVGNGREVPLRDGDSLQIGGYTIAVGFGHKTQARDPFADLFGGTGDAHTTPAVKAVTGAPGPAPAAWPPAPAAGPAPSLFGSAPPPSAGGSLFGGPPPAPSPASAAAAAAGIPDDWDPFAPDPGAGRALGTGPAAPLPSANPYIPDLPLAAPSAESSIDALFGLDGGSPGSRDPFGGSALGGSVAGPNTAADGDPLRALGMPAAPVAAPVSDHASELNTPWMAAPLQPAAAPAPPPGAVLSWNQPSRGNAATAPSGGSEPAADRTHIVIAPRKAPAPPVADIDFELSAPAPMAAAPVAPTPTPAPRAAAPVAAPAPAGPAAPPDVLLQALLDGLGMPALQAGALDAERMRLVGQLLREATRGTVELLVARAALKREMRAEMTMIVARENNPLKFSPSVEVALQHLLGTPTPGFMPPAQAMRDAFDDLRAHQLGVMAGMRAALDGVLQRFDPAVLEGKIAKRGGLGSLIPGTRKAQLWEQFQSLYAQLSQEAADDFHELFGKAFLKAYEAQLDALQHGG